ncbi:Nuclease SbcCD subunit [Lactiplantibacillus plantarum subsp. plantarum]|uniref:Nuclease SbcCD subunit n=1 Tax=Lactiplantibacillus plantarum subsp. plantarum TaxID=337330 RepID=A0A2S3U8Q0_LACPN|nr:Nuclease SbcCD subunit [Lactiplantibacillus plantarum subsp. plantarum]
MKLLHTADWHIGRTLNGYSLLDEQEAAFKQILTIALAEKVDGIVIAGTSTTGPFRVPMRSLHLTTCCRLLISSITYQSMPLLATMMAPNVSTTVVNG